MASDERQRVCQRQVDAAEKLGEEARVTVSMICLALKIPITVAPSDLVK